jgi:hypothetical protein
MTTENHPLMSELVAALSRADGTASTLEHIDECRACAVRFSRLRSESGPVEPGHRSLEYILEGSTPLPDVLTDLVAVGRGDDPQPNEVWRIGLEEAVLVWVRQVFSDGVADVVPLTLDVDLADRESIIIGAERTLLATELSAMVALRAHVHTGAFLNCIDVLDIRKDVSEVMTAVREGRRPSGVRVGPPIEDSDDQRLEYRQALRDLLAELSPSAWIESQSGPEPSVDHEASGEFERRVAEVTDELSERMPDVKFRATEAFAVERGGFRFRAVLKASGLATAVLVAFVGDENLRDFPDAAVSAEACVTMSSHEQDVDAVVIVIPSDDWQAQLFTGASMRRAVELPGGEWKDPVPALDGFGITDTLYKYFQGGSDPWEVPEEVGTRIESFDFHEVAAGHAQAAIVRINDSGRRARQSAKKAAWQNLPADLGERVAAFVAAVANGEAVDEALTEFAPEVLDD